MLSGLDGWLTMGVCSRKCTSAVSFPLYGNYVLKKKQKYILHKLQLSKTKQLFFFNLECTNSRNHFCRRSH